jgi:probable rRNA maturation factor
MSYEFPKWPLGASDDDDAEEPLIQCLEEDVEIPLSDAEMAATETWLFSVAAAEEKTVVALTYIFCSDEYLLQVNREHLDHDYYTDIITFPYDDVGVLHGDMFISTERVADNAQQLNVPFAQELRRVMVHGLLHLAGYGDKTPAEISMMRAKEEHYLNLLMS